MNFHETKGSGIRGALSFDFFKIGESNYFAIVVDHESLTVFADFEVADEG